MVNLPAVFREYKRLDQLREEPGLSLAELERWTLLKRTLSEHFQPGTGDVADKQASLRVPVRLRVEFSDQGALRQHLMTNISRGGVFIATDNPLPIGASLKLRIRVGDTGQLIDVQGEVASVNSGADMKTEEHGMGVRFGVLSEAERSVVDELYGRAMAEVAAGKG